MSSGSNFHLHFILSWPFPFICLSIDDSEDLLGLLVTDKLLPL